MNKFFAFLKDESGQGAAEYALLLAAVTIALIAVAMAFGDRLLNIFTNANDELGAVPGATAAP